MRVALVAPDLPPHAGTGVGAHVARLADALAALDCQVEVFLPRHLPGLAPLAQRRVERGAWAETAVNLPPSALDPARTERPLTDADMAQAFAAFLDRERPEVVHFEGLYSLGARAGRGASGGGTGFGVVAEAKRRGLGTVGYVHDYHLASCSPVLLRPDLSDLPLGDRDAELRCELARRALERLDPQAGASGTTLVSDLPEADAARLHALLAEGALDQEVRDAVKAALEERRAAFAALDARFASSRTVARRLSSALGRAVDWRPAGVRPAVQARREDADETTGEGARAFTFAYVGEVDKPGGLHLLLEAYARLSGRARLVIHGDSGDRAYVRTVRARALELGATWGGPVGPDGIEPLLAEVDVVVLPAVWEEGPMFVARAALAAHRPVVAPRTEAAVEVLRDDVDALLYERGDVDALTKALQRFLSEGFLCGRLQNEARPQRSIAAEAEDWKATYAELIEQGERRNARPRVPAPLAELAARHADLATRPTRELFAMVLAGLDALGKQTGLQAGPRDFLVTAAGRGSHLRDGLAEDRRAIDWLTSSVAEQERARTALEASAKAQEERIGELHQSVTRLGDAIRGREEELRRVAAERDELESTKREVERSRAALDGQLQETRESLEALELERSFLSRTLEEGTAELRLLRERIAGAADGDSGLNDREALERHFQSLQKELTGLRDHEEYLRGEMTRLVAGLGERLGSDLLPPRKDALDVDELRAALTSGQDQLNKVLAELSWRRREMAEARSAAQTLFSRIAGGALAQRVRTWIEGAERAAEENR